MMGCMPGGQILDDMTVSSVQVNDKDLEITTMRAGGKGGQVRVCVSACVDGKTRVSKGRKGGGS